MKIPHKKDKDLYYLSLADIACKRTSCKRMRISMIQWLWDKYVIHGKDDIVTPSYSEETKQYARELKCAREKKEEKS